MIAENYTADVTDRKSRTTNPIPFSGLGKLPPQAIELEEAVLGALMQEKDSFLTIGEFLKVEMFYTNSHQIIFKAIQQLFSNSSQLKKPPD